MKRLLLCVMLISITLLATQCKKDKTLAPEDILRSKKITLTNAQWGNSITLHWFSTSQGAAVGHSSRYVDITEAMITQEIMDNGLVQVYFTPYETKTPYSSLPYSRQNSQATYNFNLDYTYEMGKIRLLFFLSAVYGAPAPPYVATWDIPSYTFKYVIIPGTAINTVANTQEKQVQLKGVTYSEAEIKDMPYSQLSKLADIKE